MGKYTISIEEYCQARYYASLLNDMIENNTVPEDPRGVWVQVIRDMADDPTIAYNIVADELLPDLDTVPFYSTNSDDKDNFIMAWTDKFYFDEMGQDTPEKFRITLRGFFRENMGMYADLYKSKLSGLSELASDYKRTTHDALEKLGKETDKLTHGLKTEYSPTATQTNKIIPLGGSTETELNQTVAGGKDTTENSGNDTTERSFTGRVDSRWIVEELTGATGKDRAELVQAYRDLIIDIDSMIFNDMRKYGLFMHVW